MSDHRDTCDVKRWWNRVDSNHMLAEATLPTEDGEEEVEAKVHFEVCPTCEGRGKYVNPMLTVKDSLPMTFLKTLILQKTTILVCMMLGVCIVKASG